VLGVVQEGADARTANRASPQQASRFRWDNYAAAMARSTARPPRVKVLHLFPVHEIGGAESVLLNLMRFRRRRRRARSASHRERGWRARGRADEDGYAVGTRAARPDAESAGTVGGCAGVRSR
jgi:hypothetical protein